MKLSVEVIENKEAIAGPFVAVLLRVSPDERVGTQKARILSDRVGIFEVGCWPVRLEDSLPSTALGTGRVKILSDRVGIFEVGC